MNPLIEKARQEGRNLLEPEALTLLQECGIPVPRWALTASEEEALEAARTIGFPVVLKIVSKDILHKSDVGGVKVGVEDEQALRQAYRAIQDSVARHCPTAQVEGILVEDCSPSGLECIVGMTRDPQLGAALMFGLGGVFVEVLRDVAFQLVPICEEEAHEMVTSIKGAKLLTGYRGQAPRDLAAIEDLLQKVSSFVQAHPEINELDINPVLVYEHGLRVVDARVLL